MKFEREKDIPSFRNKTLKERRSLRGEACRRDFGIVILGGLSGALSALFFPLSHWLVSLTPRPGFLLIIPVYFAFAFPFGYAFYGLFIVPRIRRALERDDPNIA
jgi:hypothetical protein